MPGPSALQIVFKQQREELTSVLRLAGGRLPQPRISAFTQRFQEEDNSQAPIDNLQDDGKAPHNSPEEDNIKVKFHPSAGAPNRVQVLLFDMYTKAGENRIDQDAPGVQVDSESSYTAWHPFPTRHNFELSEVMLDARMNAGQIETLISLINNTAPMSTSFTIMNPTHLSKIWELARGIHTSQFVRSTITLDYNNKPNEFKVYSCPLWDWCKELLTDCLFVSQFEWDAQRLSKYNMWTYQDTIPSWAKPFCIIIFADKTQLSSFGTAKGYPVLARCANLPVGVRNGTGVGGGRLVCWLLIGEIWHAAVNKIVKSIKPYAQTGFKIECGDGITRIIYPHIIMLSANYEEQTFKYFTELSITYHITQNNIYSALSWDWLHAYHLGLFGDHILGEIKTILAQFPSAVRQEISKIDSGLHSIPPWRELNHFHSLNDTGEFADGRKFEGLSKYSPEGYHLLKILQSYLELDMYSSLTVQTDNTLDAAINELLKFDALINAEPPRTFLSVRYTSATRNYNTKPSEKANGPLKKYYRNHTNFKDMAPQILRVNEMEVVATVIMTKIDRIDERNQIRPMNEDSDDIDAEGEEAPRAANEFQRVIFSSMSPTQTLAEVEAMHINSNRAFLNFRNKVGQAIGREYQQYGICIQADHVITPYCVMKVNYASVVDWYWKVDILQTNPKFHDRPQYDFTLVQINGAKYLALTLPLDLPLTPGVSTRRQDKDLGLTRVHPQRRLNSVVINTKFIIRGALLTKDLMSASGEHLVVDSIDEEKNVQPGDI
ncbi:hypothetical protein B0H34DRAFT_678154 [Crassisporium funariophilum]|nr:hypothetical protein B0H34DRAFT_678154 [Crassisporium funariophilum]